MRFEPIRRTAIRCMVQINGLYDKDTNHGANVGGQASWQARLAAGLRGQFHPALQFGTYYTVRVPSARRRRGSRIGDWDAAGPTSAATMLPAIPRSGIALFAGGLREPSQGLQSLDHGLQTLRPEGGRPELRQPVSFALRARTCSGRWSRD